MRFLWMSALVAGACGGALSLGALAAWTDRSLIAPVTAEVELGPTLVHPGRTLELMAYRLVGPAPEPAPVVQAEVAAPMPSRPKPPPPPDVAALFRRDVSAVLLGAAGPVLIMVDPTSATQRRVLRVGESYLDGWVVDDLDSQSVVLRRRQETRTVALYSPPANEAVAGEAEESTEATVSTARRSLPRRVARGG